MCDYVDGLGGSINPKRGSRDDRHIRLSMGTGEHCRSIATDCIIVDEAHRGYTLDQEMTDGELATRDAAQYLSAYRR